MPHTVQDQLEVAASLVGYRNGSRYRTRGEFLFNGVPLREKSVLEVGCGAGAWAIWAALHGAARVIGLEPEADGSRRHIRERLLENIETLGLQTKIVAVDGCLEELAETEAMFDVVVMFNVINHLDEAAVVVLDQDRKAFEKYVAVLKKLRAQMRAGGWIIVADCARRNFWNQIGLTSPLVPWIEWHKHQNPRTWVKVFAASGFRPFDLRWSPMQPLPRLTSNWLAQYVTCSDFVMRLRAA
jgi:SAM-dependent methyltransferase